MTPSALAARPSRRDLLQGLTALLTTTAVPVLAAPTPKAADVYRRAVVIDGLTNDSPMLKPDEAIEAGMTAAIVDMQMYPRNYQSALQAIAEWQPVFRRPGGKLLPVLRAADLQ
ncbi:MAG TPA: hypothetical protein VF664_20880, partial [Cystobacter sp.]